MKTMMTGLLIVLAVAFPACSRSHTDVMNDSAGEMNDLAKVLEGVTDAATAKAAMSKIKAGLDKLKSLGDELQKMGEPSEQAAKDMATDMAKNAQTWMAAGQRFSQAWTAAMAKPGVADVLKSLDSEFQDAMK